MKLDTRRERDVKNGTKHIHDETKKSKELKQTKMMMKSERKREWWTKRHSSFQYRGHHADPATER